MKMINEEMRNFSAFPDCYNQSLNVPGNKSADGQFINSSKLSLNSYLCRSNRINSLCMGLECSVCLCAVVWSNVTECDSYRLTMRNQFKTSCKLLGLAGLGWAALGDKARRCPGPPGCFLPPALSVLPNKYFWCEIFLFCPRNIFVAKNCGFVICRQNIFDVKYFCCCGHVVIVDKVSKLAYLQSISKVYGLFYE